MVRVGKARIGRGVFATASIAAGRKIGDIAGRVRAEGETSQDHFELDDGLVLEPRAPFRYLNHSCEPNALVVIWVETTPPSLWVEALRDIERGEEITIDYAWSAADAIRCRCRSARCRGWVVAEKELPRLLRLRRAAAKSRGRAA